MITSAPPAVTGRSGTVSFEGEPAVSFQCRLDSAAYAACTSPKAYADLAEGPRTFDVRAVDVAGNAGPVDSASWTVDATGPTVAITFPAADGQYNAGYNPGCGTTTTGDVCGTASDATSAVAQVEVSLRRVAQTPTTPGRASPRRHRRT